VPFNFLLCCISDDSAHMLLLRHVNIIRFESSVQRVQRDFKEKYIHVESAN